VHHFGACNRYLLVYSHHFGKPDQPVLGFLARKPCAKHQTCDNYFVIGYREKIIGLAVVASNKMNSEHANAIRVFARTKAKETYEVHRIRPHPGHDRAPAHPN
jgi:hypothetical protein